jgi:glycosyltransferase involved in cell wall biosynthesis
VPAAFTGFLNQSEISKAYVAADGLVLPSDHGETWGLVVNEALASGLACLVSDACGCAEDLAGGGFTFPMGNIGALADKLVRLRRGELRRAPQALPTVADNVDAVVRAWHDLEARRA